MAPSARCLIAARFFNHAWLIATQGWPQELKLGKVSALAMVSALILKDFFLAASWPGFLAPSARCLIAARFFNPAFFKNLIFGPSPIDFSARRLIFAARFCDDYIVEVLAPTARCFIATRFSNHNNGLIS